MVIPYNFCFIKCLPSLTVEAVDAPKTLFRAPLTPGFKVLGQNHANNLSPIKIYSYAKFHQDWSDSLDFYRLDICTKFFKYPLFCHIIHTILRYLSMLNFFNFNAYFKQKVFL
jgi:hypothetical protein